MPKIIKTIAYGSVALTIVLAVFYQRWDVDTLLTLAITFGTIAYHFCMRLLVGLLVGLRMHNRADYRRDWYQLHSFEEKLYAKLKVKKWKDRMPTYEPGLFSVKEHSLEEIVGAMCQAEVVHEMIMLCSFLPILASIPFGQLGVFVITSVLAAGFDAMFVIMQRYNRVRIVKLMERRKVS